MNAKIVVINPDTENKSKNKIEFIIREASIIPSTTRKIVDIIRPVDQIQLSPLNEPYAKITNTAEKENHTIVAVKKPKKSKGINVLVAASGQPGIPTRIINEYPPHKEKIILIEMHNKIKI